MYVIYHCYSLLLFPLVPIINALSGTLSNVSLLAAQFGRTAVFNTLAAGLCLPRTLERLCVFGGWRFELYVMLFVLALASYSQAVLRAVCISICAMTQIVILWNICMQLLI